MSFYFGELGEQIAYQANTHETGQVGPARAWRNQPLIWPI